MDKSKLIKMFVAIIAIIVLVSSLSRLFRGNSMTLDEYARLNSSADPADQTSSPEDGPEETNLPEDGKEQLDETVSPSPDLEDPDSQNLENSDPQDAENSGPQDAENSDPQDAEEGTGTVSQLTGAILNGSSQLELRYTLEEGFYREPLSDKLRRYITGISYPAVANEEEASELAITYDQLSYVHILHYDFDGEPEEGELICNEAIAQDLLEIFYELYRNEYQLERVLLIDEYDGDDTASMEDNNTSCFNYRIVTDTDHLSRHAYGLAIDVNPLYNPYVAYNKDGSKKVSPATAMDYADRSLNFPYKIDENDLCYKLFIQHGFIWGGNWNSIKDYQHFQKTID